MADMLLSALIQIVLNKAGDSLGSKIWKMWGFDQQRERLQNMLLEIQAVLPDAEVQAIANTAVKSWLEKLKSAAYEADDVLDEFCYEELRLDAVKRGHKIVNVSDFFSLDNPDLFRNKMSEKLEKVVTRIGDLVVQMGRFCFGHSQIQPVLANRVRTDSVVVESKVLGRDEDKNKIVKLLLEGSDNVDVKVVPVVGMGGLGKTTLVQLVYNDASVKEHFNLTLWVCVSEEFKVDFLVKSIIELGKGDCNNVPVDNMELLQRRLHKVLSGKRYLLVLDDVWNENFEMWERLRDLLNCGASGSAIIVTTRSGKVASMMGTVESYNLGCLGKEDSWNLFQERAFSTGLEESQELVEVGGKIVEKCRGLPLAINTLGSLMSYKHEVQEWFAVLESKIWEITSTKDQVLPILRLSYDHLPSYMKQCFAFCAVFPKDYVMGRDQLIQFWMANGFIPSDGPGSLEMKGNDIFNELSWGAFFQDVYQSKDRYIKMHDLMHDLAQSIMEGECLSSLDVPTQHNQLIMNVRHISLSTAPLDINEVMNYYPSIRSLIHLDRSRNSMYVRNSRFVKSNSLRIFKLHMRPIEKTMITPEKMKHLRYLEIRDYNITSVPETISTLYLLQTLRLKCWDLERLPEGMRYMSSLRHLYITHCECLTAMPPGMGQLSSLQTLTDYIIGTDAGNGIEELENLHLHGGLNLYNLEEVRDTSDAIKANLIAKKNLDRLLLSWMKNRYSDQYGSDLNVTECQEGKHFEVLGALKPCNELKVLKISHYRGSKFPVWMKQYHMLENITKLNLIECRWCTEIPPIEKLPCLRVLKIKHFDNLRHLCNNAMSAESGGHARMSFPSLEKLDLSEMPNLISWCEGQTGDEISVALPVLEELKIINCPKLTTMPIIPLLTNLSIEGNVTLSSFATSLTTLQVLSLGSHDREAETAGESLAFQPWDSLIWFSLMRYDKIVPLIGASEGEEASVIATKCKRMYLLSCNLFCSHIQSNSSLWFWKCFTFLEYLHIQNCESLVYWPEEEFRSLNSLRSINLRDCSNFIGPKVGWTSDQQSIEEELLPKVQHLSIESCPNLVEFPMCPSSIRELRISYCPKLQCLPEWLGSKTALKCLEIVHCKSLNALPMSTGGLTNLEKLEINFSPDLACLPEGLEGLKSLEILKIVWCPKMKDLPEGLLQQLKNLDELWIEHCPELERHFRNRGKYQHLISDIWLTKIGETL